MRKFLFYTFIIVLIIYFSSICNFNKKDFQSFYNEKKHLFFAHRGVPYLAENSVESFSEARNLGFSALETDIHFTKDNKLIVFHDDNTKRLLGIDLNIEDCNWEDLRDHLIIYNRSETSNKILLFKELLINHYSFQVVYLDIKANISKLFADRLLFELESAKNFNTFFIADSNILFLAYLKFKNSEVKTILEGYKKGKEWFYYLIPVRFRPDYLASSYNDIDINHISFLKEHKLIEKKIVYAIGYKEIPEAIGNGLKHFIVDYHTSIDSLIVVNK
jgi:hypothetical protein